MPQNEKNAKPIGGPGGRGGHGPRPNVKNPGKLFMRLLSYIMKNYAVHCVIVVICIFITVLASVQGTWFMQTLIDGYILPLMKQSDPDFSGLAHAILRVAVFYGIGAIASYIYTRIMVNVSQGTLKHLRDDMFTHMEELPIRYFDTHSHGDIMSTYTNDIDTLRQMISQSMPQFLNSIISIVSVFISMLLLNIPLTLVTLAMVGVTLFATKKIGALRKAIMIMGQDEAANACLLKAKIMLNLDKLDSASYFFNKNVDQLGVNGKVVCYNGMYQVAKKKGEWETAVKNIDMYKILYDSIQIMADNEELNRLMDKHQLEEHKRTLSEHAQTLFVSLVSIFLSLTIICIFCFMWNDRKRKKRYIALQQELTQKRVDTMLLKEEKTSEPNQEHINKKMSDLREQQLQLCISMFQTTDCYNKLETLEKSTPKQLLAMRSLRADMRIAICEAFVDVMVNLKECCPSLTNDDLFYCVLSSLHCSKTVIMELMDTTSDALKTRKNRIKNKMGTYLFEQVFTVDNL